MSVTARSFSRALQRAAETLPDELRAREAGSGLAIALDPAASGVCADGLYTLSDAVHAFSRDEMVRLWCDLVDRELGRVPG